MNSRIQSGVIFCLMTILMITSCQEDHPFQPDLSRYTLFRVSLTDNPTDLEEVNIDLKSVVIKGRDRRDTVVLDTEAGVYNLLDFQNGLDTVIAGAVLEDVEFIQEVRLILGENNSVKAGGEYSDLKTPSGQQSGLKIKTCIDLTNTLEYELLLDFDAEKSVVRQGNGRYLLKPVIRVMNEDARCGADDDDGDDDGGDGDDIAFDDLPLNVQEYLDENYGGYGFVIDQTTLCYPELEVFRIKAEKEEEHLFLYFSVADGELVQTWTVLEADALPEAVRAVAEGVPAYVLPENNLYLVETSGGETWYQVGLEHKGNSGKKRYLLFDGEGNILCEKEV